MAGTGSAGVPPDYPLYPCAPSQYTLQKSGGFVLDEGRRALEAVSKSRMHSRWQISPPARSGDNLASIGPGQITETQSYLSAALEVFERALLRVEQ